jgi:hypothetical protein
VPSTAVKRAVDIAETHQRLIRSQLEMMRGYAETTGCRRQYLRHGEWGDGVVMRIEDDRMTVLFETNGYKTLCRRVVRENGLLTARIGLTGPARTTGALHGRGRPQIEPVIKSLSQADGPTAAVCFNGVHGGKLSATGEGHADRGGGND